MIDKKERIKFINELGYDVLFLDGNNLKLKCSKCGGIFERVFSSFKKGIVGCPECKRKEKIEFLNNLGFIPVSENLADSLEVKCLKCNGIFKRSFNAFFNNITSCPKCEEKEKLKFLSSLNFTPISKSLGHGLKVKCNKCGGIFARSYDSFIYKSSKCPECIKERKLKLFKECGFTPISSALTGFLILRCNICGYEVEKPYSRFKSGTIKCENCYKIEKLNFLKQFGFTPISKTLANNMVVKCDECGHKFNRSYDSFKRGAISCPKCNPCDSGFEKEVAEFIGDCEIGNLSILNGKEIDIFIPHLKLAIECNGEYWHSEQNGKDQSYHLEKTKLCQKQGVQLIHIFELDWINKKDVWKSILNSKLGRTNKIFARKCIIQPVPKEQEKEFLETNHLQGFTGSTVCYGLYYKDELVQLMSFGKPRFSDKADWELIRLASKLNITVVGGASKLFKYFIKNNPGTVLSYSDNMYSNGSVYKQLGFKFNHFSKPGYFYYRSGIKHSRQQFMKHLLSKKLEIFDPSLTEAENMVNNGYYKVWDCGQSIWLLE